MFRENRRFVVRFRQRLSISSSKCTGDAAAANAVHKAQSPVMRVGDEAPLTAAKAGSAAPAANIALAATFDIANGVDVILTGEVDGHMIDSMADAKPVLKTSTPDAPNTPEPSEVPVKSETYAAVTSVATALGETRLPGTSPMMNRARRESYIGGCPGHPPAFHEAGRASRFGGYCGEDSAVNPGEPPFHVRLYR